jgi:ankyrin repeat protein
MTRSSIWTLLLALTASLLPLRAQDQPDLRTLLRDALFTEEVTRDAEKAAQQYEQLLARHAEHQAFAATALFRLAEVRRKQNRNDEAIALYQRLIREFPTATTEVKLATENLATLGAKPLAPTTPSPIDESTRELKRFQDLVQTSPDRLRDPELLLNAVREGHLSSIDFLLKAGAAAVPWKLLNEAVTTGNLRTTSLILDFPFGDDYRGLPEALFTAVSLDYLDVTKLLLAHGAEPTKQGSYRISENTIPPTKKTAQMTALHVAVRKRNLELVKLLLDHKADPNQLASNPAHPDHSYNTPLAGTPLHDAVLTSLEITRLLIERGANVNTASETTGVTPLHLAVRVDENEKIIQLLIENGASLDAAILVDPPNSPPGGRISDPYQMPALYSKHSTPLQAAICLRNFSAARELINVGASIKNPNILIAAIHTLNPQLVDELLQKGALNANFPTNPIRHIAGKIVTPEQIPTSLEILNLLIQHGAKSDPEWLNQSFSGATPHSLLKLHQTFMIPSLLEKPAITLVIPSLSPELNIELATRSSNEPPASLASLLLQSNVQWPLAVLNNGNQTQKRFPTLLTRWRKGPNGTPEPLQADLSNAEPLPDLQWGDVLELSLDWENTSDQPDSYNIEYNTQLPQKIAWTLRKQISFPITVEIDGNSRTLTLRGDRLIFDPGSEEVPLLGAAQLMSILWQPLFREFTNRTPKVTLIRKNWPEVNVPWGETGTSDVALQAGDKLRFNSPPVPDEAEKLRTRKLFVTSPGLPFSRTYGEFYDFDLPSLTSIPTLFQVLTDLTGDWTKTPKPSPSDPTALENWLADNSISLLPLQLLPHPDYSKIQIRRLKDDGSETIIPVNLQSIITTAGPDVTAEVAKKSDITLQFGDIVEIPQKAAQAGKPYHGLTPAEANFFSKALSCRIQWAEENKPIQIRELHYQAPRFIEFEGNWIPLWPQSGTPSLRAIFALDTSVAVTRNLTGSYGGSYHYLRDGDIVRSDNSLISPPPAPQPTRPSRPRIVPIPPPGN